MQPFPPFFPFLEPWFFERPTLELLIDSWNRVSDDARKRGRAEELHAVRDDYQVALQSHLKVLEGYLALARLSPRGMPYPEIEERLAHARDKLQAHYDSIFPRWKSLEDLEAILLERVSLPNDRLKALAQKHPPPRSWYDQDEAPRRRKKRT
jgi:hypothetical protein